MKMKFRDFVFPSNPSLIKSSFSSKFSDTSVPGENSIVENVSINPAVITGNGEFFGDDALENCTFLQRLLKERISGWLFAPGITPIKAFLTEFEWEKSSKSKSCSYSFKFVEDSTDKQEREEMTFVTAKEGQNAFDIAFENGVSVDDIMSLNEFKTPFDIKENDRVILR